SRATSPSSATVSTSATSSWRPVPGPGTFAARPAGGPAAPRASCRYGAWASRGGASAGASRACSATPSSRTATTARRRTGGRQRRRRRSTSARSFPEATGFAAPSTTAAAPRSRRGINPAFACLFSGPASCPPPAPRRPAPPPVEAGPSATEETVAERLEIDHIFARNHGIETADGTYRLRKYWHPPVGRNRFVPPVDDGAGLPEFFTSRAPAPPQPPAAPAQQACAEGGRRGHGGLVLRRLQDEGVDRRGRPPAPAAERVRPTAPRGRRRQDAPGLPHSPQDRRPEDDRPESPQRRDVRGEVPLPGAARPDERGGRAAQPARPVGLPRQVLGPAEASLQQVRRGDTARRRGVVLGHAGGGGRPRREAVPGRAGRARERKRTAGEGRRQQEHEQAEQQRRKITAVGQGDPRRLLRLRGERHRVRPTPRHVRLTRRLRRPRPDEATEGRAQRVHIQRPAEQDSLRRGEQRRRHGTVYDDFAIGGLDLLSEYAPRIDAIFMDPPWGGVDYSTAGKEGYLLERDMVVGGAPPGRDAGGSAAVDGAELLRIAAGALESRIIGYDLPRNTNKMSLARACLDAGYEGHVKLEEHYLNGRLKTVTAYMGEDYRHLFGPQARTHNMKRFGRDRIDGISQSLRMEWKKTMIDEGFNQLGWTRDRF
ncbi:hypothetical protein THAOC_31062, partial [Thalassiosira oceanica]